MIRVTPSSRTSTATSAHQLPADSVAFQELSLGVPVAAGPHRAYVGLSQGWLFDSHTKIVAEPPGRMSLRYRTARETTKGTTMHIYSATLQAKPGRGAELGAMLPKLRDEVAAATGGAAYAWVVSSGAPIGSFGISTRVEGNAQLMDFQQKLAASKAYQTQAVKAGDVLFTPATTSLSQIVGFAGEQGEPAPVVNLTQSTIVGGHLGEALGWSMEVLEYVHSVTGMRGLLTSLSAGGFFDVMWIFSAQTGAELDDANAKLMADKGYIGLIDKAGGLFVPGAATRVTLMQMP
jgi:hypothetical protein